MLSFVYKRFDGQVPEPGDSTVYVIVRVVDNLKTIPAAILPHTPVPKHRTQKLHEYLGYEGQPFGPAQGKLFGTQQMVEYQEEARHGGLRAHQSLTYDHNNAIGTHSLCSVQAWAKSALPAGQALREPAPLFKKLDESRIDEEYAQLEA